MISDTLCHAIQQIEDYQRNYPEWYDDHKGHIEVVKRVMGSLQGVLDGVPLSYPPNVGDKLSDDQKARLRVMCEANIAMWAEGLRLLGPVTGKELVEKPNDSIQRQDAILAERLRNEEQELSGESGDDGTTPAQPEGRETRTFRARWCGHVEIEAGTKDEALDIHGRMNAKDILDQLIFDGIEED